MGLPFSLRYHQAMMRSVPPVGDLLREWRQRRRRSQLELAGEASVSTRHLSFIETGRSLPSRDMVLHLAESLEIPLRERNTLLVSAGYAPVFPESGLTNPEMNAARKVIDLILSAHEPYPALAIDRHWTLLASNQAIIRLLKGVRPELLRPPVNVLRLSLHPDGLAPRIANLRQWRSHVFARLKQQIEVTADRVLEELLRELRDYPVPEEATTSLPGPAGGYVGIAIPLQIVTEYGTLALFSTTTVFGTPVEITLSEIAIESFFPADPDSAEILRRLAERD